jgi:membrane protein
MQLQQRIQRLLDFLTTDIWLLSDDGLSTWQKRGLSVARAITLSLIRFKKARSDIQAAALTAITVLTLVPMMAFGFSIAKALGFYTKLQTEVIEPVIERWINVEQAPELRSAIEQLLAFVENTDFSSLGTLGFITIAYAVIRLLGSVEAALNDLWEVQSGRSIARKISDYLSVAIIVPVMLLIAGTASGALSHVEVLQQQNEVLSGDWSPFFLQVVTWVLVWFGFSVLYRFMPNTQIKIGSAIRGGVFGGSLWMIIHLLHIKLQIGVANYNAIYAGFSAFPIFMVWVYFSWWAVLIGGSYAAAHQIEDVHRQKIRRRNLNFRNREQIALQVAIALASAYREENTQCSMQELQEEMQIDLSILEVVLTDLEQAGLVVVSKNNDVLLAKESTRISLFDVLEAVKGPSLQEAPLSLSSIINCAQQTMSFYRQSIADSPANKSLAEVVEMLPREKSKSPVEVLTPFERK